MCLPPISINILNAMPKTPPEQELAALMEHEVGVSINPYLLKLFIRFKWPDLIRLAHAIHDGDKPSNSSTT